jgi:ABC-2 type transport system permease protein
MELKGMRIYKTFLLVNLFIMPLALLFMMIMNSSSRTPWNISYLVSGFIVVSLMSSFLGTLTNRVSNIFEPSVLELYSTLPPKISTVVLAQFLTYSLLVLPQVLIGLAVVLYYQGVSKINVPLLVLALLLTFLELGALAVAIGAKIGNPYKAMAVTGILPWLLVVFSPAYYRSSFQALYLNPVTHLLSCIRSAVGLQSINLISWLVSGALTVIFVVLALRSTRSGYMLEKPF